MGEGGATGIGEVVKLQGFLRGVGDFQAGLGKTVARLEVHHVACREIPQIFGGHAEEEY